MKTEVFRLSPKHLQLPDSSSKRQKISKGSGEPNKNKVGSLSEQDLKDIASIKMSDLNANTLSQAVEMIRGTCVSMGIEIKG